MDEKAKQLIALAESEKQKAANFRALYQEVANLMYPVENQITSVRTEGEDKSKDVRDPTGIIALDQATSGFLASWIPKDREFFGIRIKDRKLAELPHVKQWTTLATQITHDELFESNFLEQIKQTIKSCIGFGTGCIYSEYNPDLRSLVFKDWHVSFFTIQENAAGRVDSVILDYELTARQLAQEFANPGAACLKDASDLKTENNKYRILHIVRPRKERNVRLINNLNMPYESIYINVKEQHIIEEGGYEEFPFAVPRWERSSCEKYGRGRGTMMLSAVKELQQMHRDFLEVANKWNNPPLETVDAMIEGLIDMSPGARNHVYERDVIRPINPNALGNFPITVDVIKAQQDFIANKGFYNDIFSQFRSLQGDRRVTLELELRNQEGLDQLITPVISMEAELFNPLITRTILLLIRNGRIPPAPAELAGAEFAIDYMGKLAMAMKQYQARAFLQFAQIMLPLSQQFPETIDMISMERAIPDIAIALGMKAEHMATEEELNQKRQARQQQLAQMQLLNAAQTAAKAVKDTSKKPEEGSPAEELLSSLSGA
ncbi:MAG TPA: portal protein [Anaerohalosphaeraceae bacterium]|nr:portal protein [Anaerohalosphaeraceae bacterium]